MIGSDPELNLQNGIVLVSPGSSNPAVGNGSVPLRIGSSDDCQVRIKAGQQKVLALVARINGRWHALEAAGDAQMSVNGTAASQAALRDGDRLVVAGQPLFVRCGASKPDSAHSFVEKYRQRFGQLLSKQGFRLNRLIHSGAGGVLFEADWNRRPGEPIALKFLAPHLAGSEEEMFRFCRGVTAGGDLRHPNVIRLYRAGKSGDAWYLAMELARCSLRDIVERENPPADKRILLAIQVGIAIGRALEAAADHGLLHRRLIPTSVLISPDGAVKLGDFTLARNEVVESMQRFTLAGNALDHNGFMAPELALGSTNVDARSDVYSAAALLYYVLASKPPLEGGSLVELIDAICRKKPDPPSARNPRTPEPLEQAILKGLEKEPARRFASAREFRENLESLAR